MKIGDFSLFVFQSNHFRYIIFFNSEVVNKLEFLKGKVSSVNHVRSPTVPFYTPTNEENILNTEWKERMKDSTKVEEIPTKPFSLFLFLVPGPVLHVRRKIVGSMSIGP